MIQEQAVTRQIYTVSLLNREARLMLDNSFPPLWVEGEISNLRIPSSGHLYFSLKDESAQIRCAMFRMRSQLLNFRPKDGAHVMVRGKLTLYEERGDFQLVIDYMEETGDGILRRKFEMLKSKLAEEGLFNTEFKKPIPLMPRCVGVITSATGAAIRDILSVLKRRFPSLPIIIYPTLVQGSDAAAQIAQALKIANQRKECDVLILARGGGSLEDLWPFNEEIVARAIFASIIPIVCGVGHEIDVTISDFVADYRAPTPSAAAELVSPNIEEWQNKIMHAQSRINHSMRVYLKHLAINISNLAKRLQHPSQRLQNQAQQLDYLEQRLIRAHQHYLRHHLAAIKHLILKLQHLNPQHKLQELSLRYNTLEQRLRLAIHHKLEQSSQQLNSSMRALDTVSPLNTLERGYAIVKHNAKVITQSHQVKKSDKISIDLAKGKLKCIVDDILQ